MKRILLLSATMLSLFTTSIKAQYNNVYETTPLENDKNILNHLDVSVTFGTTGIGFDFASPIGKYLQVRAGATFMPHIKKTLHYNFGFDDNGVGAAVTKSRFERVSKAISGLTGSEIDNNVSVVGQPTFNNFKFLVDVFPLHNKKWHITTGVFIGSSTIGTAMNTIQDMPKLMSINTYNNIYNKVVGQEYIFEYDGQGVDPLGPELNKSIIQWGLIGVNEGKFTRDILATEDIYYEHDVIDYKTGELLHEKGELKVAKGDVLYHKGDTYKVVPDKDNTVSAKAKVWSVKPYIGIGYGTPFAKGSNTSISFDVGMMLWGGSPSIITHDGIDLVRDVEGIGKNIGTTVDFIKQFKVFPVASIRITHRFF